MLKMLPFNLFAPLRVCDPKFTFLILGFGERQCYYGKMDARYVRITRDCACCFTRAEGCSGTISLGNRGSKFAAKAVRPFS